jgi:hypothetical protein
MFFFNSSSVWYSCSKKGHQMTNDYYFFVSGMFSRCREVPYPLVYIYLYRIYRIRISTAHRAPFISEVSSDMYTITATSANWRLYIIRVKPSLTPTWPRQPVYLIPWPYVLLRRQPRHTSRDCKCHYAFMLVHDLHTELFSSTDVEACRVDVCG